MKEDSPQLILLGLDGAGKTRILYRLHFVKSHKMSVLPTIGFNVETITHQSKLITIWDIGGDIRVRPLWKHYLEPTSGRMPIWVIDASDPERFLESQIELWRIIIKYELPYVLVYANKQDRISAFSTEIIASALKLYNLNIPWHVQPCCASCSQGLPEGLDYFLKPPIFKSFSWNTHPPLNSCHLLLLGSRCPESILSQLPQDLVVSLVRLLCHSRSEPFCSCRPHNKEFDSPFLYERGRAPQPSKG